jgi:protoporphyrinogen oxidase
MDDIVIVGGGIAGMLSAYLLSQNRENKIHLIEKSNQLGGLLKSFDYKEFGRFDYGAHNILESGIEELDELLFSLLSENEWTISSAVNGQKRALTGTLYNGKIQKHTPFVDLRDKKDISKLQVDFLENIDRDKEIDYKSAYSYAKSIFGKKISKKYIDKIFKNIYGVSSKEMNYMAMFLTPLTRVGLFNKNLMDDLLNTKKISSHLAYPDQNSLDVEFFGTKRTYYPKDYGIYRVIDALEKRLVESGVVIHLDTTISDIEYRDDSIINVKTDRESISNIKQLFWSAGLNGLDKMLKIDTDTSKFQPPKKTVITNLLIDKKLDIGNICYLYNYDNKFKFFRIDNYINYCQNAKREYGYPISVEMLLDDKEIKNSDIETVVKDELQELNILPNNSKINFCKTEVLEYGFPLLSNVNIEIFDNIRENIKSKKIKNLTLIGVLANKDLFFESDIKKDLYVKVKEFMDAN